MNKRELVQLIAQLARRDPERSEATIQADVRSLLLSEAFSLEGDDVVDREAPMEAQVGDGTRRRIDIEAGFCVIEVKKKLTSAIEAAATATQLPGYVAAREAQTGARYAGILTDGRTWKLYRLSSDGTLVQVRALTLNAEDPDVDALIVWLESVFATGQHIPSTPAEVTRRLGAGSPGFDLDLATLTDLYRSVAHIPEVALKRELWSKSLSTALGTQFSDTEALFINHTYLVAVAELVAHLAVGFDISSMRPNDLLTGAAFRNAGFRGVVEADFFDWVTDLEDSAAAAAGARFIAELGRRVARFDWASVEHDVLKALYESVISADTRHTLGEYYTPDWLAAEIVTSTVDDPIHQRVLDPSCGSGTFLFAAIRAVKKAAAERGMSPSETLAAIVNNVIGLDLHPVAVTLARVTYLLAIGPELYGARAGDGLLIPVFLGDSLQWDHGTDDTVFNQEGLTVRTRDGLEFFAAELKFPAGVIEDVQLFDALVAELAQRATNRRRGSAPPRLGRQMLARFGVSEEDEATVVSTFNLMCQLHDTWRDHIWGYYVRNLARPLWLARPENRVDVLVGNPPWLAHQFMSPTMKLAFKERCTQFRIRPAPKFAPHTDLSALFVVTAVDRYLKVGGKFGFVMPRGALGGGHYREFRSGTYPVDSGRSVTFDRPWDLGGLRPHMFPVPSCVVFGRNTSSTTGASWTSAALPTQAVAWSGRIESDARTVPDGVDRVVVDVLTMDDGPRSPYHDHAYQGAIMIPRSLILAERTQAGPLAAAAGTVPIKSRRGADKEPWKSLPDLTGTVESRFLHPALLGSTLVHFALREPELAVIPWDGTRLLDGSAPELEMYPGLAGWWRAAELAWDQNSAGTMTLREQLDYRTKLTAQFRNTSLRVVYSTSGTYLAAAILNDPAVLVDHSAYWIPVTDQDEATYLVTVLNSDALATQFSPLQPTGQFGTRHFHRYPLYPSVPRFERHNDLHARLVELGMQAMEEVASLDYRSSTFVAGRQRVREHLDEIGLAELIDANVNILTSR